MKKRGAIFPKYDRPHLFQTISLLQLPKLNTIVIRMSMAIAVWLFGCMPMMWGQSAYERELWNTYNSAPDFSARKTAFDKLEKFYRLFHLDSALIVCNQFRALAAQSQPDYVPFVDLSWVSVSGVDADAARVRYAGDRSGNVNLSQVNFFMPADDEDDSYASAALGLSAQWANGWSGFLSYRQAFALDRYEQREVNLGLRMEF